MNIDELPLFRDLDPQTSKDAGALVAPRRGSQAHRLLMTFNEHRVAGLTDEQAAARTTLKTGQTMIEARVCWWKRCSDLRALGFIEATGERRQGSLGADQMVSRITVEGFEALKSEALK